MQEILDSLPPSNDYVAWAKLIWMFVATTIVYLAFANPAGLGDSLIAWVRTKINPLPKIPDTRVDTLVAQVEQQSKALTDVISAIEKLNARLDQPPKV